MTYLLWLGPTDLRGERVAKQLFELLGFGLRERVEHVRVEIEHRVFLTQVCLVRDSLDVILAVLDEAAVGQRAAVLQQALCEPRSTCWSVVVFAGGTKR